MNNDREPNIKSEYSESYTKKPSVYRDSRFYRKNKPAIALKKSNAKLPKQGTIS